MFRLDSLLAGAVSGGLIYGLLTLTAGSPTESTPTRTPTAAPTAPSAATAAGPRIEPSEALRLGRLEERLVALEGRLAGMGAGGRDPVAAVLPEHDSTPAAGPAAPEEQRALVLAVLEDERLREEQERQEERRVRELERAQERADRVAEALELSGAERDTLASIYADEGEQRLDLVEELRDLDPEDRDARDQLRDDLRGLRDWTAGELELRLGVDIAARVETYESENRGGRFGGPGGFGRGGGR